MTRQATDNLYIELDYFTPEDYYVYVAEVTAAPQTEFSQSADVEIISGGIIEAAATFNSEGSTSVFAVKITDAGSVMESQFSQTATISHIFGSDLFAFSEASISVAVDRIRDNNIDTSAVFNTAIDYIKIVQADSIAEGMFTLDSDAERSRDYALDAAAAFSFEIIAERIALVSADFTVSSLLLIEQDRLRNNIANLDSNAILITNIGVIQQAESILSSEFNLTASISHIQGADIVASSFAELEIDANLSKDFAANIFAQSLLSVNFSIIKEDFIFIEVVADLDASAMTMLVGESFQTSSFEITVANDRIRDHDSSQTTEASIFVEIQRQRDFSSDLTADTVQTAAVNAILTADSSSISTTELFCIISHIQGADIIADSFAELEVDGNVIRSANSGLIAEAILDAQAMVLVGLTSDQIIIATVSVTGTVIFSGFVENEGQFTLLGLGSIIKQLSADLVASGGLLAIGRDIRLDTKVYVIPPETRIYSIAAETRIDSIDSETRIYTIRSTR
jgi:hypothetical protein